MVVFYQKHVHSPIQCKCTLTNLFNLHDEVVHIHFHNKKNCYVEASDQFVQVVFLIKILHLF